MERFDERREIVRVGVHLVAIPGLARSAMAPPVMRDAAEPICGQKHHLVFPGVRAQRPAMAEDHRLSRAPVFEVNLCAVIRRDRAHKMPSSVKASLKIPACTVVQTHAMHCTLEEWCGPFR